MFNKDVSSRPLKPMKLIKPIEAAEILMCSERTLEAWRREKKGPCYYKLEGKILYKTEDIFNYIENSKVSIKQA